jgi:hypothetical protein
VFIQNSIIFNIESLFVDYMIFVIIRMGKVLN